MVQNKNNSVCFNHLKNIRSLVARYVRIDFLTSLLLFNIVVLSNCYGASAKILTLTPEQHVYPLGMYLEILEDPFHQLSFEDVASREMASRFVPSAEQNPNFGFKDSAYWVKFRVEFSTLTLQRKWYFVNAFPMGDHFEFYYPDDKGGYEKRVAGIKYQFGMRDFQHRKVIFEVTPSLGRHTFYMKVVDQGTININLKWMSEKGLVESVYLEQMVLGLFYGMMLVMFFYNLFVFISVKERAYFFYLVYVATNALSQFFLNGYAFQYLLQHNAEWYKAFVCVMLLSMYGMVQFSRYFLHTWRWSPRFDVVIRLLLYLSVGILVLMFFISERAIFQILSVMFILLSLLMWMVGIVCWKRGNRAARVYVAAWSMLILSVIAYQLQNLNIIPTTMWSNYGIQIGGTVELVLLSLALADRINVMRSERERVEQEANEQLQRVNEQLEQQVIDRSGELTDSLAKLESQYQQLKETQAQLMQAEKMSSLGTLVSGVAHEINNPTHFSQMASQNLSRDLQEFNHLLESLTEKGEEDIRQAFKTRFTKLFEQINTLQVGTQRIANIVKDLRIFSRLESSDVQTADVAEIVKTTLHLVKPNYRDWVRYQLDAQDHLQVDCRPTQLSQLFLNVLVNASEAVQARVARMPGVEGLVVLKVGKAADKVVVSIKDNGVGMDGEVIKHVFEPFFTTKDVGEGTGLGMSLSYSIVKEHGGDIWLVSSIGEGTEVVIELPSMSFLGH